MEDKSPKQVVQLGEVVLRPSFSNHISVMKISYNKIEIKLTEVISNNIKIIITFQFA